VDKLNCWQAKKCGREPNPRVGKPQVPELRIHVRYDLGAYYLPSMAEGRATYAVSAGTPHTLAPGCAGVLAKADDAAAHTPGKGRSEKRGATSLSPGARLVNLRAEAVPRSLRESPARMCSYAVLTQLEKGRPSADIRDRVQDAFLAQYELSRDGRPSIPGRAGIR
jgi:hypothetical protein